MTRNPNSGRRVVVLGGGITGLTAAWHLLQAGYAPVVYEKTPRLGGAIKSIRTNGWLHDMGPNSVMESSPDVAGFIDAIGLGPRRLYASPAAKQRYIVRDGQLVAAPTSPLDFVETPLFSTRAKLGLLGEPFRRRGTDAGESVADFVRRRLGQEFLDYAVNPLVGGVYAGDPECLSVRHAFPKLYALEQEHGSLIRGALKRRNTTGGPKGRIFSFPDGLSEMTTKLGIALGDAIQPGTEITAVRRAGDVWELDCERGLFSWMEVCDAMVCALPADGLAAVNFEGVPAASRLRVLAEIQQPPVASVFMGYRREDLDHPLDGFGVLVPQVEGRRILGALFSSTLFPDRAPEGHVALTAFVGGMRQPELANLPEHEMLSLVHQELRSLLGIVAEPVFTHIRHWPRAIPQYSLDYQRYEDAIAAVEASVPGLFVGGNCRDGISLANCITAGRRLAEAVLDFRAEAGPATRTAFA